MKKGLNKKPVELLPDKDKNDDFRDYPLYPESEDIYNKSRKEKNIDPEDVSKVKTPNKAKKVKPGIEEESNDDESGNDLDIPGSELDDEQENIGNEDEENNYYSIGGDEHNDLDEDDDLMKE